jgi:hypothetical protein
MLSPFCWWVKLHPSPDPRYQRATDEAQAYEHQTDGPIGVEPEGRDEEMPGTKVTQMARTAEDLRPLETQYFLPASTEEGGKDRVV